jgi:molecular chaperone GrpE
VSGIPDPWADVGDPAGAGTGAGGEPVDVGDAVGHPAPGHSDGVRAEDGPVADPLAEAGDVLLADVAGLVAQRDEYLGSLQRLQADFENYRKRVLRQQEDQSARAALDLVGKLLPVLDTLDLAQAHLDATAAEGSPSPEALALTQSRTLLIEALAKEGLDRVDVANAPFDPVVHDAVAHAPDDGAGESGGDARGPVVDEVLRAGYRWRGQVLRPAMVRVRG